MLTDFSADADMVRIRASEFLEDTLRSHFADHEITRELTRRINAAKPVGKIIVRRDILGKCWVANGVPLPFHHSARPQEVAASVAKRFPHSDITVRI